MALKIIVKGIKYFKKDAENDEVVITASSPLTCREILLKLGLDKKIIGYYIFEGKPLSLDDKIDNNGTLQIIPFLSGG